MANGDIFRASEIDGLAYKRAVTETVTTAGEVAYLEGVTSSGGGGGGGAVTVADGADVAEGTTTDAAYASTNGSAAGTLVGILKGLYVALKSALSVVGNVASGVADTGNPVKAGGVYNLTPPTYATGQRTDLQADNAGNLKATPYAGTTPLIFNGALADGQSNSIIGLAPTPIREFYFNGTTWDRRRGDVTGAWTVGNVASGATDSGNPVKVGGIYNTSRPTLVSGQRSDLQLGQQGSLNVTLLAQDSTSAITAENGFVDGVSNARLGLVVASYGKIYNGATWDRSRKPNVTSRIASTAATGSPTVAKAAAGDVWNIFGAVGAVATFLQIYNKASAPVIGTDTPILTIPMAATAFFQTDLHGLYCSAGVAYAFTTDAAGTTAAAAAAVTAFGLTAA